MVAFTPLPPQGSTITVCGDVHGQYYDLMHIWELNGLPTAENPYLFNGAPQACLHWPIFASPTIAFTCVCFCARPCTYLRQVFHTVLGRLQRVFVLGRGAPRDLRQLISWTLIPNFLHTSLNTTLLASRCRRLCGQRLLFSGGYSCTASLQGEGRCNVPNMQSQPCPVRQMRLPLKSGSICGAEQAPAEAT